METLRLLAIIVIGIPLGLFAVYVIIKVASVAWHTGQEHAYHKIAYNQSKNEPINDPTREKDN
jgi:hypothetical protein